jgi:hypothetical protein
MSSVLGASTCRFIQPEGDAVCNQRKMREGLTEDKNRCELRKLRQKLKVGGKIAIVVPAAGKRDSFTIDDMNNHLYSW